MGLFGKKVCPICGGTKFILGEEDFEEVYTPIIRSDGSVIAGAKPVLGEDGSVILMPERIPFYKPKIYPVLLQKNV